MPSFTSGKSAADEMETSRLEVMECEKEIQSIKNSLKSLNNIGSVENEGGSLNTLKVSVHKLKFTEDNSSVGCTFKVHLSSPIEEGSIVKLHDPLDPAADGSFALFESVETSNALLTIEVFSAAEEVQLGVSAAHDLQHLLETVKQSGGKQSLVDFAIVSENNVEQPVVKSANESEMNKDEEGSGKGKAKTDDKAEDGAEKDNAKDIKPAQDSHIGEVKESKLQLPLCTLSVHLEYTPSINEKRDALYDKLNEVSKRKAAAIESLRASATAVNRAKISDTDDAKSSVVKSGFLNKSKAATATNPFWKRWYNKTIGTDSMVWVVGPIAKNYVIFFAVSAFLHTKGDLLALPPPV